VAQPAEADHAHAVAVPIHLEAQDKDGARTSIQYYMFVDVPMMEIRDPFLEMAGASGNSNDEVVKLRKRVDSMEQQLDLVTRQLNAVLKKLDSMEKK
jgi:hypothetical protein